MEYDAFIICPVRKADKEQRKEIIKYIKALRHNGKRTYYPRINTDQKDDRTHEKIY